MAFLTERLDLQPSRQLQWLLILLYGAAAVAPFLSGLPAGFALSLVLLVCGHGFLTARQHLWLTGSDAVIALRWSSDDHWFMTLAKGPEREVVVAPQTLLLSRLCLLVLRPVDGGPSRRVVIFGDSGDSDVIRRLRVRLRFLNGESSGAATRS